MNLKNYIEKLIEEKTIATIYLINGIKLQGQVASYDDDSKALAITSHNNNSSQIVLLQAVSTIS